MKRCTVCLCALVLASVAGAGEWFGLADANRITGPKLDPAKLKGRIVLVERWGIDCYPCRMSLPHVQKLYKKYGSKGVVVLGAHYQERDDAEIKELIKSVGAEFPVYQFAGYSEAPGTRSVPAPYLVDHTGKVVWSGSGFDAAKVEEAVTAALKAVPDLERDILLEEIAENLEARPGVAYLRLQAFLKRFPKEKAKVADAQAKLKDPKVRNLAKLEEELAKLVKAPANSPAMKKKRSDSAKAMARKAKAAGSEALEREFLSLCE